MQWWCSFGTNPNSWCVGSVHCQCMHSFRCVGGVGLRYRYFLRRNPISWGVQYSRWCHFWSRNPNPRGVTRCLLSRYHKILRYEHRKAARLDYSLCGGSQSWSHQLTLEINERKVRDITHAAHHDHHLQDDPSPSGQPAVAWDPLEEDQIRNITLVANHVHHSQDDPSPSGQPAVA